jgi:hypothetical protein
VPARSGVVMKPSSFHSLESSWRIHVEPAWGKGTGGGRPLQRRARMGPRNSQRSVALRQRFGPTAFCGIFVPR